MFISFILYLKQFILNINIMINPFVTDDIPVWIPLLIIQICGWGLLAWGFFMTRELLVQTKDKEEISKRFLAAIIATVGFMITGAILLSIVY
jgi:hypothetical protein